MNVIKKHLWMRKVGMFILDIVLMCVTIYVSMELRFEMYVPSRHVQTMMHALPVIWVAYMGCYAVGGVYKIMWRYAGVRDTARLCLLSGVACVITLAANQFMNLGLFRGVLILIAYIATLWIVRSQELLQIIDTFKRRLHRTPAGETASDCFSSVFSPPLFVAVMRSS